jgi:hypothetical protein
MEMHRSCARLPLQLNGNEGNSRKGRAGPSDPPGPHLRPMGKGQKIFRDQLTSVLRAVSLAAQYENFIF